MQKIPEQLLEAFQLQAQPLKWKDKIGINHFTRQAYQAAKRGFHFQGRASKGCYLHGAWSSRFEGTALLESAPGEVSTIPEETTTPASLDFASEQSLHTICMLSISKVQHAQKLKRKAFSVLGFDRLSYCSEAHWKR